MFPDERERDLIQRINRSDTYLYAGRIIAVPKDIQATTLFDVSPFPLHIDKPNEKVIVVDQNRLAWGAYNPDGSLVKWGALSSGKDFCPDIKRSCRTMTGIFYVFVKKGSKCKSNIFPVGRGGSNMPYCMFYFKGYALHGSTEVYGRRASHGCIRLFTKDAKWLNHDFVDAATREGRLGTKVMNKKRNITFIIILASLLVSPTILAAKEKVKKRKFPIGCFPVGYNFKFHVLTLNRTAKYHPQTIYLVHNKAKTPVNLRQVHKGDKPYVMHLNTTIRPNNWSVLATDESQIKFICTLDKKGAYLEQVINCANVLEICEFPHTKFGDNHRGNYWVFQRSTANSAKIATRYHGVLMIDPKKTKLDKKQGN